MGQEAEHLKRLELVMLSFPKHRCNHGGVLSSVFSILQVQVASPCASVPPVHSGEIRALSRPLLVPQAEEEQSEDPSALLFQLIRDPKAPAVVEIEVTEVCPSLDPQSMYANKLSRSVLKYLIPPSLCSSQIKIDPDSLLPKLPKKKDLKPYPHLLGLQFLGHSAAVTSISVHPTGQWLASGELGTTRDKGSLVHHLGVFLVSHPHGWDVSKVLIFLNRAYDTSARRYKSRSISMTRRKRNREHDMQDLVLGVANT